MGETRTDTAWQADDAHRAQADAIANALGEDLFSHCCDTYRMRMSGVEGTVNVECLDDGPPDASDPVMVADYRRAAKVLEDPHTWPLVYLDESGRRFEVEVDVTVRALPDVAGQLAEHDRLVAEAAAAVQRNKARLSADRPVLPGGLRVRSIAQPDGDAAAQLRAAEPEPRRSDGAPGWTVADQGRKFALRASVEFEVAVRAALARQREFDELVVGRLHDEHPEARPMWRRVVVGISADREPSGFEDAHPLAVPPDGLSRNRARRELLPVRAKAGDQWRAIMAELKRRPRVTPVFDEFGVPATLLAGDRLGSPGVHLDVEAEPGDMLLIYGSDPGPLAHATPITLSQYWAVIEAYDAAHPAVTR